ncbi:MAG: thioredoxin family protein [Planctomycetota bacterium]
MPSAEARSSFAISSWIAALFCLLWLLPASEAAAQVDLGQDFGLGGAGLQEQTDPVTWKTEYRLTPDKKQGQLVITADVIPDWVLYALTQKPKQGPIPLGFTIKSSPDVIKLGEFTVDPAPHVYAGTDPSYPGKEVQKHDGKVTWKAKFEVVDEAKLTAGPIDVAVKGQTCKLDLASGMTSTCLQVNEKLKAASAGEIEPDKLTSAPPAQPDTGAETKAPNASPTVAAKKDAGEWKNYPLALVLSLAFLAGLILNVMPCVLPVIGLKIMSFVNQAGSNYGRVVLLNLVFSAGIISVFLVLATLAAFFQLGWGGLYQQLGFTVLMISVVFVFGLSFLGVWEIPIPGFSGNPTGGQKEGLFGAFLKGVLTTFLATPCSGPLLVPAVVWAMAQPMIITYLVFFAMGVGMAAPYLLLGLFPQLVRTLPRPGNWMEVFKQLMGFVLMAAVVFFISAVPERFETSVLTLLVFLAIACWIVGRTSIAAETAEKLRTWLFALAVAGFGVYFSFNLLIPKHELDWQPYSKVRLNELLEEGKPVFVDFTAEWCGTCKTNERLALNSRLMKTYFEEKGVITLKADFTDYSPEISEILKQLGNEATAIPYYAYFRQGEKAPVHFNGLFLTPQSFLDKLKNEETLQKQTAAGDLTPAQELDWQPYTQAKLNELLEQQKGVFLFFTAEWDGTSKSTERLALNTAAVKAHFENQGITTLKVDLTDIPTSQEVKELLKATGRDHEVTPSYFYFPQGQKIPVHFDGVFHSPESFLDQLKSEETLQKQTAKNEQGNAFAPVGSMTTPLNGSASSLTLVPSR